jgi:hypothetical protein
VQRERHICGASVRGLSASFILGKPYLRIHDDPRVGCYDHPTIEHESVWILKTIVTRGPAGRLEAI